MNILRTFHASWIWYNIDPSEDLTKYLLHRQTTQYLNVFCHFFLNLSLLSTWHYIYCA